MNTTDDQLFLQLIDDQWPFDYVDHDRQTARAIVFDDDGFFYFVRADRDDDFGKAITIATAGGGVEQGECLQDAIKRELKEELGITAQIVCKIGVVSDYYNLIHRHNVHNYFLCKAVSFGNTHLTDDEINRFHISTLKITYEQALAEYKLRACTKLGRLLANREIPVLQRAKVLLDELNG